MHSPTAFLLTFLVESELTLYLCILTSVFIVVRSFFGPRTCNPTTGLRLPGPRGLPYVGSLPFLGSENEIHLKFTSLAKQYGKIFRLSLGSTEAIIISDADLIREAFRMEQFAARPDMLFVKQIVSGNGLILSEGDLWKEQRRFALQQLRNFGMYRLAAEQDLLAQKISREIQQFIHTLGQYEGKPIVLDNYLSGLMGNINIAILCGKRFEYSDPIFLKHLNTMEEGFRLVKLAMGINFMPFLRFVPMMNSIYLKIKSNNVATREFFGSLISEHADTIEPGKTRDFVDAYLHQIQRLQNNVQEAVSYFTDAQMMQCVIDLFSAGMETTKATLQWAFLYMSIHPEIQERVQQEIDEIVGGERRPSIDDFRNMPYTEATICEVLRNSCVLPLGNPHAASEDTYFNGYVIPKGATIIPNLWAVHNDDTLWENPSAFNPDRFLRNGQVDKPPHFMPFSTGRRVCLGEQLAKSEIFLVFTSVLQRFTLLTPPGDPIPDCSGGILGISLAPKPYRLTALPRCGPAARPA